MTVRRRQLRRLHSYRAQLEEREQQRLAACIARRDEAREDVTRQQAALHAHEARLVETQRDPVRAEDLVQHHLFLQRLERELIAKVEALRKEEALVEEQRRKLQSAHRHKRAVEVLVAREARRARDAEARTLLLTLDAHALRLHSLEKAND